MPTSLMYFLLFVTLMSNEHKKVYMLLELQKIKELSLPHLYVFPTDLLEFSCILFKRSGYVVFRMIKDDIDDGWSVAIKNPTNMLDLCKVEKKTLDAHETLLEVVSVLNRCVDTSFGRDEDMSPFVFRDVSNRERNITALLSFIDSKCSKYNQS